ncbi:hypothetical protein E3T26_12875 [Cryobacterium sp. TMT1-21]|uniref:hypothetical protein n=1 Tax=unclassified Cryobacterium TaxID=2649013 RepID=UPI00106CF704|nr:MULTISPECIES: hypothetical protein [unclassified Cryobacterium]TFD11311.1 hypothetical protein E3T26_12875 [Cryobacterium sp. TMT1-21]TFD17878.1 hypothetical protein E3T42_07030 [Cryobacterium sp. TMT4-10]
MSYFSAVTAAVSFLLVGVLLTGCSATTTPTGTSMNDSGEVILDSSAPDATSIMKVDLCAWADQAAAQPSFPVTVSIPENGSAVSHFVSASAGVNTVEEDGETVQVSCDLLYDDTFAVSLEVELSFDPTREFTPPPATETTSDSLGAIELSGFLGYALLSEPLQLQLAESTYLDITVFDTDARYYEGEENFATGLLPIATEMAAIWKSGEIPVVTEGVAETASLDWADPSGICGAINDDLVGLILGVAPQVAVVTSNSGTDVGTAGIAADSVYCTYEVPNSNATDPLYPHRLEVKLYRYDTDADAAFLFSSFQGYGGDCTVNETAIMWDCDGGTTSTATLGGRLQPIIQTFDGAPANVDTEALHANILSWSAAMLSALAEFSPNNRS